MLSRDCLFLCARPAGGLRVEVAFPAVMNLRDGPAAGRGADRRSHPARKIGAWVLPTRESAFRPKRRKC
jgi:hypothetical protein